MTRPMPQLEHGSLSQEQANNDLLTAEAVEEGSALSRVLRTSVK
jgi:hypothetical protein